MEGIRIGFGLHVEDNTTSLPRCSSCEVTDRYYIMVEKKEKNSYLTFGFSPPLPFWSNWHLLSFSHVNETIPNDRERNQVVGSSIS